jgi:hypothetical protein
MKSLYNYILENGYSVAGKISNKILLFDIDDTIIQTSAQIWVKKNGKYIKKLTNAEYNDYKLSPGEEFDYKEFDDLELLNNEPLKKYWYTLKREYNRGTHIGIVTARGSVDLVKKFLLNKGIDVKDELIFAIGDPQLGLKGSIHERKAQVIEKLFMYGYKKFVFFDDNEYNLIAVKSLEKNLPIKIITIKA